MLPELASRHQAQASFDQLMEEKEERKAKLARLVGFRLTSTDNGIRRLERWFMGHVEGDVEHAQRLRPIWYSVITDAAVFLGDVMIDRRNELYWQLYTSDKRSVHYHWPAIMGFSDPEDAITPQQSLAVLGHRAVAALPIRKDLFLDLIHYRE